MGLEATYSQRQPNCTYQCTYMRHNGRHPLFFFTFLNPTPIFEWYVVRCGFKNEHQKDVSQEMITILGSIGNNMEGPIWPFNEHKNLHFDNE